LDGGPSSRIFKAQLHNALIDMGYRMIDKEFDKLWDKLVQLIFFYLIFILKTKDLIMMVFMSSVRKNF
jgi:hypothetical protein